MRWTALFVAMGLLSACGGMTEDEFADEFIVATCDKMFECTSAEEIEAAGAFWVFGADSEECQGIFADAEAVEDTGSTCEFDSSAAQECLDAYNSMSCEDAADGTTPDACNNICAE